MCIKCNHPVGLCSMHTSTPHIHAHKEMDEATCPDALLMQLFPKLLYIHMMCVASRSQDVMYISALYKTCQSYLPLHSKMCSDYIAGKIGCSYVYIGTCV